MDGWLNHRSVQDWRLLLEEFWAFDWLLVAILGLLIGLFFGWWSGRVSKRRLAELEADLQARREARRKNASLEKKVEDAEAEIEKLKKKKTPPPPPVVPLPLPEPPAPKKPSQVPEEFTGLFEAGERVVFILDVSKSMERQPRKFFENCKKKLQEGVIDLREFGEPQYQVIFFAGPAWFAHQKVIRNGKTKIIIEDPKNSKRMVWERDLSQLNAFKYKPGIKSLPPGNWRVATSEDIALALESILNIKSYIGTTWHRPLTMAMQLDPPPQRIDFLTDGQTAKADQVAKDIVAMVKEKGEGTVINTFGIGKGASEPLRYIAKETGGSYYDFSKKREPNDMFPDV